MVTLVALHGNGGGGFRFSLVGAHLPDDLQLVAPSLPGFAGGPPMADTSLAALARHVLALLAGLPRPLVLLGHGIGGSVALEVLQQDASAVNGVILHAPVGARLDTRLFPRLMRLPGATSLLRWGISSPLTRPLVRRRLFTPGAVPRATADRFLQAYGECQAFGPMFEVITPAWWAGLTPHDTPSVLLWGKGDGVLGADQVHDYRRLLPRASVELVEDWTHWPMLEQPAGYATAVARLARSLG